MISVLNSQNFEMKGEYIALLISFMILLSSVRFWWEVFTLLIVLVLLIISEFFSSVLVSNNVKKSVNRVQDFLFLLLQNIYRGMGLLTPRNDSDLRSLLNQPMDYSVELGFSSSSHSSIIIENKELLEAEKALFQQDDKYALHLLIIFGFPLVYFLIGLFFHPSLFYLITFSFIFYSGGTILYSFLSDESYSFEGISESLSDINGKIPFGLKDLISYEKYIDLRLLEISQLPLPLSLSQSRVPVATLIQTTTSLDFHLKKKVFENFLTSFQSFKEKETIFIAKKQVQRSKSVFAMIAVAFILGIFVAISHSIFTVLNTLPTDFLLKFPLSFPYFLPELTGLLFASLNKGYYKPIVAFTIYYTIFIIIASLFSNLIVFG